MPRVREIEEDAGDPALADAFKKQRELFGDLLNPAKVMAHCPPLIRGARGLGIALEKSGQLAQGLRDLVSLRVAQIIGCPF